MLMIVPKPVFWMGSSLKDLQELSPEVKRAIGFALYLVQIGETPLIAKPLQGFGGATVQELIEDYSTDTYRAVYTVRFAGVVYVLHVFQKKSKRGRATPQADMDLIKQRLRMAEAHYKDWVRDQQQEG